MLSKVLGGNDDNNNNGDNNNNNEDDDVDRFFFVIAIFFSLLGWIAFLYSMSCLFVPKPNDWHAPEKKTVNGL